ncbi:MAG: hypothetical protein CTY38_04820 [Methylotenera sp.]|uniref:hypothetical protein n=1 Tax=Methylotenera sp. TaxID=2051956 RepID=UPI000D4D1D7C|nr:hypothetical protein [Methylotenera sp.]PPC83160.1 MAG: hypothetical protein CTY38_04820 [Methylotenera sp.]
MNEDIHEENLNDLASILSALHQSASDPTSYQKTLDQVGSDFEQILQEKKFSGTEQSVKANIYKKAAIHVLQPIKGQRALLDQIKLVSGLTDRQLRLITRCDILRLDQYERPILDNAHSKLITKNKALAYLFMLGVLTGAIATQIILQPIANPATACRGLGLGIAIGSIAGLVLDRSFRAFPVVEELQKLAPWVAVI